MKELIESTKRLQGDIDKCISNLIHARQYHDKIEEAGAVLDMERLLVSSAQLLQCCIDKLEECGSVVEWQTSEPKENGFYIVSYQIPNSSRANVTALVYTGGTWINGDWQEIDKSRIIAWCKLSNIKPYKEKEE